MKVFGRIIGLFALLAHLALAGPATAEGSSWLQLEAQPTLAKALDRARFYTDSFSDVSGFRLGSGWYAVVLGPMTAEDAANRLDGLRVQKVIPFDSFVADGSQFGERFWPVGDNSPANAASAADAQAEPAAADAEPVAEPVPEPETREQALAAEKALENLDREDIQSALAWYGYYEGAIDGAFGKGTRKSIAAWQAAQNYEETGVLTTPQRHALVDGWKSDKAEFGFETVTEAESGVEISLPLGLVEFDSYAPPFVQYREKGGSGLSLRLISEPGDGAALGGLYSILQTLDVMPSEGERTLGDDSFTLRGKNDKLESFAYAKAEKGAVKGFLVTWTPALDGKMGRILPVLQTTFRSLGAKALDPGLVPLDEAVRRGLLAGLEARQPVASQSGLYVSAGGAVVTSGAALTTCGSITLERDVKARVAASDAASGLVLLQPETAIAPQAFASFAPALPQKGAQVAAVGWSYGDRLPAPVVNPGLLEDTVGLDGSTGQIRLALDILPGDAGGPVLNAAGQVIGLVLPGAAKGPALPQGVALAASDAALTALMAQAQLTPVTGDAAAGPATPDALSAMGLGMTALVSCWE